MDETEAAQGLSALGNQSRLAIFRLLVRAGDNGSPTGHIGRELGVPLSTLAHHIDCLSRAGLVDQRKVGREVICTANYKTLMALTSYLTEKCCEGLPEGAFETGTSVTKELVDS